MAALNGADVALTIMDDLLGCLTTALEDRPVGLPCSLSLIPGIQAWPSNACGDGDCSGVGWVRLDRIYSSAQFPLQDQKATQSTFLVGVIELGILRCVPTLDNDGNGPDDETLTNTTITVLSDAAAMIQAVACCTAITARPHTMSTWQPRDSADMSGGVIQTTVELKRLPT